MRALVLIILWSLISINNAKADFWDGHKAPERLQLAPDLYQELYAFWRDQYEITRSALYNLRIEKRPAVELPYIYTYGGVQRSYNPPEKMDLLFIHVMGPPALTRSSLRWLGLLSVADALKNFQAPENKYLDIFSLLKQRVIEKNSYADDFGIFTEGLTAEDLKYFDAVLEYDAAVVEDKKKQYQTKLYSSQTSLNTFQGALSRLCHDGESLGYDPTLKYKVDYAERYINYTTYYSYEQLNADLRYLNEIRAQMYAEYEERSKKASELREKISTYRSEIALYSRKVAELETELSLLYKQKTTRDEIIAAHKLKLESLFKEWGFSGQPFNQDAYEKKIYEERLDLDRAFSAEELSYAYPLRRARALERVRVELAAFEKACNILDKTSNVKCVDLSEYLLHNEDEFLSLIVKTHYKSLERALEELHFVHYEAAKKLQEHFKDPEYWIKNILGGV